MKEPIPGMEDLTEEVPVEEASRQQKMMTPLSRGITRDVIPWYVANFIFQIGVVWSERWIYQSVVDGNPAYTQCFETPVDDTGLLTPHTPSARGYVQFYFAVSVSPTHPYPGVGRPPSHDAEAMVFFLSCQPPPLHSHIMKSDLSSFILYSTSFSRCCLLIEFQSFRH